MVGILAERGIEPTPAEATALALGVHEDTGSLTYPSTTLRDVEALAFCARHGAGQELIGRFLHSPLRDEQRSLLSTLVETAEPLDVSGVQTLLAAVRWPHYVDGVSGLASKIIDITDCEAMVMLVEMAGRVFAVGRSRTPALDVAAVMAALGGGGHAAGGLGDRPRPERSRRCASASAGALPSGTGRRADRIRHHVATAVVPGRRDVDRGCVGRVPQATHLRRAALVRRHAGRHRRPRGPRPGDRRTGSPTRRCGR